MSLYEAEVMQIMQSNEGLIRSLDLLLPRDSVKKIETATLVKEEIAYSLYELELSTNERSFVDLTYYFNGMEQLSKITVDVYLSNKKDAERIYDSFHDHFSCRYPSTEWYHLLKKPPFNSQNTAFDIWEIDFKNPQYSSFMLELILLNDNTDAGVIIEWTPLEK